MWLYIYHSFDIVSYNCDFLPHKSQLYISQAQLYLTMWLHILQNDFIACNCNFISHIISHYFEYLFYVLFWEKRNKLIIYSNMYILRSISLGKANKYNYIYRAKGRRRTLKFKHSCSTPHLSHTLSFFRPLHHPHLHQTVSCNSSHSQTHSH